MKKKIIAALMIVSLMGGSLMGCGNKEISNDYVKITQYKGLEVDKVEVTEVTDEDVESNIQSTLESYSTAEEVTDRAVENGDTATIDYTGKVDGEEFENGSGTDYPLVIGSGSFINGFEEAIIGHEKGETFDIDVTFPEDYNSEELAGKAAVFTIVLHKIEKSIVPELNDEFVASVSEESTTVDEYKKEVKKTLQENNEKTAKETLENSVREALMNNTEVTKYPDDKVSESIKSMRIQYEQMAGYYGVEWEEFLTAYMGMTEEDFDEQLNETAKTSVKGQLALELIAEKEKLEPSEKEYQEKYEQYAAEYGYESVDALIEAATEETLKEIALQEIVLGWLVDNCKEVEPSKDDAATEDTGTSADEGAATEE